MVNLKNERKLASLETELTHCLLFFCNHLDGNNTLGTRRTRNMASCSHSWLQCYARYSNFQTPSVFLPSVSNFCLLASDWVPGTLSIPYFPHAQILLTGLCKPCSFASSTKIGTLICVCDHWADIPHFSCFTGRTGKEAYLCPVPWNLLLIIKWRVEHICPSHWQCSQFLFAFQDFSFFLQETIFFKSVKLCHLYIQTYHAKWLV